MPPGASCASVRRVTARESSLRRRDVPPGQTDRADESRSTAGRRRGTGNVVPSVQKRVRAGVASLPVAALVAAALAAAPTGATASGAPAVGPGEALGVSPALRPAATDGYINYVAPQLEEQIGKDRKVGEKQAGAYSALSRAKEVDQKHAGGNPVAAKQLARVERKALQAGVSPSDFKQADSTQTAQLLTILVEFNEEADDDFSGVMRPETVFGSRECVTTPSGTLRNGPAHNKIPNPADYAEGKDNNSFWVPDFSPEHFDKMLYSEDGITKRVRSDLKGPDGKPGIDISGYTMRNMYEEMSKGAYSVRGQATDWVQVEHSEAWYAADVCTKNADGEWEPGAPQDNQGHPDNKGGVRTLALDAVAALAAQQPDFPFDEYDVEDQGDVDGDGDLLEPDGVIDHVVLVHAGEDKSGGGGAQGTDAIWAHSSTVTGGASIPGTDLKVSNYIVQPEDSGVGVFAHEYGHDLGLPDLYDTTSGGDSDVDFWDLMSSGSHSGPIFQSMPTHMGIWDKWVLGWADPLVVEPGDDARKVRVGQASRTPVGTEDGVQVMLPEKSVTIVEPLSGTDMWWSGNDQDWAKNTLTRSLDVPAGSDLRFWMQNNFVIEEDWDFGFVEVSTDGGSTWEEQVVRDEAGEVLTTAADYADPNGRLKDFGGKKFGLTGTTDGWSHDYVDLTPYAGKTVQVRLLYATDEAFVERGWFADDFSLTSGTETVWEDDVEGDTAGWTAEAGTFVPGTAVGAGWRLDTGTQVKSHYYLVEWRNFDGFDEGLKYAYDTTYSNEGPWKVEKIRYNAPGMLVWYRDTTYGNDNPVLATSYDLPSTGTKGGLLVVDSHFNPLRRKHEAADKDTSTLNNVPSRAQSSNAAFNTTGTYPFRECLAEIDENDPFAEYCTKFAPRGPVSTFTDAKTWYPGLEFRAGEGPGTGYFFRDQDASVVVPSKDTQTYSTRITDGRGRLLRSQYGTDLGLGSLLGSGNPSAGNYDKSDGNENLRIGVSVSIQEVAGNKQYADLRVQPAPQD